MTHRLHIEADLSFSVDTGRAEDDPGRRLQGTVTGSGRTLRVQVDGLDALPLGLDRRGLGETARDAAQFLADEGLTVVVAGPKGPIVSLGERGGLIDRTITRSGHITVHDKLAALRLLRTKGEAGAPSLRSLAPPGTPWPPTPTVTPVRRRRVRTTHDPLGGGDPRLVYYTEPPELGGQRRVLPLRRGTTSLGSAEGNDLVVEGLRPRHAEVRRDPATDEYLLVAVDGSPTTAGGAQADQPQILRTGARVQLAGWTAIYRREEYADHGRPFGGRQGGEFSRQRPQPPRPRYDG